MAITVSATSRSQPQSKRYRLPCACSATVPVVPGQAGGRATCPACGAVIDVPRLRDLAGYAVGEPAEAAAPWSRSRAWLLVMAAVAAAAAVAAFVVPRFMAPPRLVPDESAIRAAIDAVDAATIYKAWQAMRGSGIDRGALPEELRLQQAAGSTSRVVMLLWGIAAVTALAAAVAGGLSLAGSRSAAAAAAGRSGSGEPVA